MAPGILRQQKVALEGDRAAPKHTAQGGRALNSERSPPSPGRLGERLFANQSLQVSKTVAQSALPSGQSRSTAECPGVARGSSEEPIHQHN